MKLNPTEVISFFKERKGMYESRYGVVMKMDEDNGIFTTHQFPELMEMSVSLRLVMDEDSVHSFIEGYKLQSLHEIDRISYNYLWMRYLNGEGAFFAREKAATNAKDTQRTQRLSTPVSGASLGELRSKPTVSPASGENYAYEIGFRLISSKTIVFCKELNFYDEINEHLTMPDELEEFAGRVMEKLEERRLLAVPL